VIWLNGAVPYGVFQSSLKIFPAFGPQAVIVNAIAANNRILFFFMVY
jgi:hypothetical protein